MIQGWNFEKLKLKGLLAAVMTLAMVQVSYADTLLMDMFAGTDPDTTVHWTNAGVTESLADAAAYNYNGGVFNIAGGLTMTTAGNFGTFQGSNYGANVMLNGYAFTTEVVSVSVGGFETGGVANTLTTSGNFAGVGGNTFVLEANQGYKLYLFGTGDNDPQNTEFVFGGETKVTSAAIANSADDAGHFVTYEFTTGADLTNFSLDFTFGPDAATGGPGAFNGFALTAVDAVPEPTSFGLLSLVGFAIVGRRRRSHT